MKALIGVLREKSPNRKNGTLGTEITKKLDGFPIYEERVKAMEKVNENFNLMQKRNCIGIAAFSGC